MTLEAARCPNGHLHQPPHPRCPDCGEAPTKRIDLSEREATVVTWTTAYSTPPGVREPNSVAIVEFEVSEAAAENTSGEQSVGDDNDSDHKTVRAIGGLATGDVAIGDRVRPVYVEQLREPGAGIREPESQEWSGYRFEPV